MLRDSAGLTIGVEDGTDRPAQVAEGHVVNAPDGTRFRIEMFHENRSQGFPLAHAILGEAELSN
jgi:hypothetical protein